MEEPNQMSPELKAKLLEDLAKEFADKQSKKQTFHIRFDDKWYCSDDILTNNKNNH